MASPGGSIAFLILCTRLSVLVKVPSFSAKVAAGKIKAGAKKFKKYMLEPKGGPQYDLVMAKAYGGRQQLLHGKYPRDMRLPGRKRR